MQLVTRAVHGSSGALLACLHSSVDKRRPSALIALPFGVPARVATAAFDKLAAEFNVVTWKSRYILNLAQQFSGNEKLAPIEHVRDMISLLAALEIERCMLIGYCSGAGAR